MFVRHADADYANDGLTDLGADRCHQSLPARPGTNDGRVHPGRRGEQGATLEWPAELQGLYAPGAVAWDMHPGDFSASDAAFCDAGVTLSLLAHLLHIAPPLVYAHSGCDPSSVIILESDEMEGWASFRPVVANDMSHAPGLGRSPRQHRRHGFQRIAYIID